MKTDNLTCFKKGMQHGIPISLGYLAVSFTLGIAAKNAGMTAFRQPLPVCLSMLLQDNLPVLP